MRRRGSVRKPVFALLLFVVGALNGSLYRFATVSGEEHRAGRPVNPPARTPALHTRLQSGVRAGPTGTEFATQIGALSLTAREAAVLAQVAEGNLPRFLRQFRAVSVTNVAEGKTNTATFQVMPDYLAIGSDADYLLMPVSPGTAQRIADRLDCSLPTPKMVDAIYGAASVKLPPVPIPPSAAMTSVAVFSQHNAIVREQRERLQTAHPLGALSAGHKKDLVITPRLISAPGKVAIYGWHQTNGEPIQPLYLGHTAAWVDYSQCARLVRNDLVVNGQPKRLREVLSDPAWCGLLSDEGVIPAAFYPTNLFAQGTNSSVAAAATPTAVSAELTNDFSGFTTNHPWGERVASFVFAPDVKIHVNAPPLEEFASNKMVQLVFYALPNGNTTEQTIGKVLKPGDDWHYDIQHIGAQTRFLRSVETNRTVVVAYLENSLKSWPAWRRKYGDGSIAGVLARVRRLFAPYPTEVVLNGHSGGGSLIFGYLNTVTNIPAEVRRIAFLDSNYAYDRALGHKDKLVRWLKADGNCLCVVAYNDAVALLNGKTFVSPAGGTWGRSHTMQTDLSEDFEFKRQADAEFERFTALQGRIQFILKENPQQQIFHTVQVERNGFIHSLLIGTPQENQGYEYFGARAYSNWIR